VSTTALNDVVELIQQRVEGGYELIRNTPVMFERVRQTLMRRAARLWKHKDNRLSHFYNLSLSKRVVCNVGIGDL
jgi:hypothetical protein